MNADDLGTWIAHFNKDERITKQADMIAKLHKDVFEKQKIE